MDSNASLSQRANAFSISALMSGPFADSVFGSLTGYPSVPTQCSTDCLFDWGPNGGYSMGMKGMEGKSFLNYFIEIFFSANFGKVCLCKEI